MAQLIPNVAHGRSGPWLVSDSSVLSLGTSALGVQPLITQPTARENDRLEGKATFCLKHGLEVTSVISAHIRQVKVGRLAHLAAESGGCHLWLDSCLSSWNRMAPVIKRKGAVGPGVGQRPGPLMLVPWPLQTCPKSHFQPAVITCLPSRGFTSISPHLLLSLSHACFLLFPAPMILAFLSGLPVLSLLTARSLPFSASRMTSLRSKQSLCLSCFDASAALRPTSRPRWLPVASWRLVVIWPVFCLQFFPHNPAKPNLKWLVMLRRHPPGLITCSFSEACTLNSVLLGFRPPCFHSLLSVLHGVHSL